MKIRFPKIFLRDTEGSSRHSSAGGKEPLRNKRSQAALGPGNEDHFVFHGFMQPFFGCAVVRDEPKIEKSDPDSSFLFRYSEAMRAVTLFAGTNLCQAGTRMFPLFI